jgi:hypothetical protein
LPLELTVPRLKSVVRAAAVFLMLGLWLATALLSASPGLHRALHHDAPSGKHECLATQFSKNHLLACAPVAVGVAANCIRLEHDFPVVRLWLSSPDHSLAPGRAPPAV